MTANAFIRHILTRITNLFFTVFTIPNEPNVYIGWVLVSGLCMGITLKTILNLPRAIPSLRRSKKDNG